MRLLLADSEADSSPSDSEKPEEGSTAKSQDEGKERTEVSLRRALGASRKEFTRDLGVGGWGVLGCGVQGAGYRVQGVGCRV